MHPQSLWVGQFPAASVHPQRKELCAFLHPWWPTTVVALLAVRAKAVHRTIFCVIGQVLLGGSAEGRAMNGRGWRKTAKAMGRRENEGQPPGSGGREFLQQQHGAHAHTLGCLFSHWPRAVLPWTMPPPGRIDSLGRTLRKKTTQLQLVFVAAVRGIR